ncbi:MAG: ATP-binding protein, partial [Acidimicrobiia bacterium]
MSPGAIATMSEAAAEAAVSGCCRELHLPTIRTEAASLADAAARGGLTHRAFLAGVLLAEVDERAERRRQRRLSEARFPRMKRLSDFNCSLSPVPAATVAALAAGAFIDAGTPVVLLGDSGTGKSHLLIGLGIAACEAGRRVR